MTSTTTVVYSITNVSGAVSVHGRHFGPDGRELAWRSTRTVDSLLAELDKPWVSRVHVVSH